MQVFKALAGAWFKLNDDASVLPIKMGTNKFRLKLNDSNDVEDILITKDLLSRTEIAIFTRNAYLFEIDARKNNEGKYEIKFHDLKVWGWKTRNAPTVNGESLEETEARKMRRLFLQYMCFSSNS